MKRFSIFKKKHAKGGVIRPIIGITDAEYNRIHDALREAYREAVLRQKSATAKPSGYMKGLKEAIRIVDSVTPHTMEVI